MTEPVSLADIKAHLRLDVSETDEDVYLQGLITAARRGCEKRTNLSIVGAGETIVLAAFPGEPANCILPNLPIEAFNPAARAIALAGGSVASVSITYFDADGTQQTLDPALYIAALTTEPAQIAPIGAWPATAERPDAVTISYVVSPLAGDDLAVVAQAMKLICGSWYKFREANAVDVRGTPAEIPLSATWLLDMLTKWATE